MARKRYLIVGDGAAGTTAAQYLRQADPAGFISIYSDDPNPAYFRAALTNYLLGELREDQIWAVPPTFYAEQKVNRVLARVAAVETGRSQVWLASGGPPEGYDALLVAAGARARPPAFEGAALHGVMTMRTLQDVRGVMDLIKLHGVKSAVVLGGGPLALEWALGLRVRGVEVTIVMRDARFMPGALDAVGSDLLTARLRHAGISVRGGDEIRAAVGDRSGRVSAVVTTSGQTLPCQLVAVAIGVICNTEFLNGSGVAIGPRGGVAVDARMRTNVANVFAAGDIAERDGRLLQLWEPARLEARVAAVNMVGSDARHEPGVHYMATRLYDLDFASLGDVIAKPGDDEISVLPKGTGKIAYKKLVLRQGRLVGALLFGEREERVRARGRGLKQLIDEQIDVTSIRASLLEPGFDLQAWLHTRELTDKPAPARDSALPMAPVAKMKGTQLVAMAPPSQVAPPMSIVPPPSSLGRAPGTLAIPSAAQPPMKGTQLVSLGGPPVPETSPRPRTQVVMMQAFVPEGEAGNTSSNVDSNATPYTSASASGGEHDYLEASRESGGRKFELRGPVSSIGRDRADTVALDDPGVSHVHAQITRHGEELYLRDLGSRSGTWVNGGAVIVPHRLRDGDRVRVGSTELTFRSPRARGATALPSEQGTQEATPHLEVRAGRQLGLSFALAVSPLAIGSDPRCPIRLDDRGVAPTHAQIVAHEGQLYVYDVSGGAGVVRNGAPLPPGQPVLLVEGDHLTIGQALLFFTTRAARVQRMVSPSTAPPPPVVAPPQPPRAPRRARLVVRGGVDAGRAEEISDRLVVGAQMGACHLLLRDPQIGPLHLELTRGADGVYARDMGAPAGTYRLGQRFGAGAVRLTHGDALYLGPSTVVVFEEEAPQ